jgi:hypothetical protein
MPWPLVSATRDLDQRNPQSYCHESRDRCTDYLLNLLNGQAELVPAKGYMLCANDSLGGGWALGVCMDRQRVLPFLAAIGDDGSILRRTASLSVHVTASAQQRPGWAMGEGRHYVRNLELML